LSRRPLVTDYIQCRGQKRMAAACSTS